MSVLTLFGLFAGCTVVTYGAGKAVMSLIASKKADKQIDHDYISDDSTTIDIRNLPDQGEKEVLLPLRQVDSVRIIGCSVSFSPETRKYSLTPEVENPSQNGLVFLLYKDDAAGDVPVASSTEKNPDKILSVRQSEKPYYLVAVDTVYRRSSAPFRIVDCKPRRIRRDELESAINNHTWEAFQRETRIYKAISEQCVVYHSGSRMVEVGTNALFVIFRNIKDRSEEGRPIHITVTDLKPGTEENDYRVTEVHYIEN